MPLVTVKAKFQVTIPAGLRKDIDLREGDLMEATLVGDGILLRPKDVVDRKRGGQPDCRQACCAPAFAPGPRAHRRRTRSRRHPRLAVSVVPAKHEGRAGLQRRGGGSPSRRCLPRGHRQRRAASRDRPVGIRSCRRATRRDTFAIGEIERLAVTVESASLMFGLRDPDDEANLTAAAADGAILIAGTSAGLHAAAIRAGRDMVAARGSRPDDLTDLSLAVR